MMTDRYGWNLSVYDRLHVPVITPSAGEKTTVTYEVLVEKRRSGEGRWFATENYTDSGADSPGRLHHPGPGSHEARADPGCRPVTGPRPADGRP